MASKIVSLSEELQEALQEDLKLSVMHEVKPLHIASFLGRPWHGRKPDDTGSRFKTRTYGTCAKHFYGRNSIKMYDKAFSQYPNNWGLKTTDRNIDHRRVPNLQTFFKRRGKALPVTQNPADYLPGDLVTWNLLNGLPHIGIVSNQKSDDGERLLIVHNIGAGAQMEDILFEFEMTGHYRYFP